MIEKQEFKFDVFLSYTGKDKSEMRKLAGRLRGNGLSVWFDESDFLPTSKKSERRIRIEECMVASRVLVLAMSKHITASEWAILEGGTFRFRDPASPERRFIPLQLDDSSIPDPIKKFAAVAWRKRTAQEYARLLAACQPNRSQKLKAPKLRSIKNRVISFAHSGRMFDATFSGNGDQILSGAADNTLMVWDVETGRCKVSFTGHEAPVVSVAVTPNGLLALSGSGDKTMRMWDLLTGHCLATLVGHHDTVQKIALSADGRRVVSASHDTSVWVWDVNTGRCLRRLEGHTGFVKGLALSSDGCRAVSGADDKTVGIWDVDKGRCLARLQGHTASVRSVALSNDGRRAISGSDDCTVRVWDCDESRCTATLEGHTDKVWAVTLSGDGRRAVSASDDQMVRVWDLDTGFCVAILEGHTDSVSGIALSGDGRFALTWAVNGVARLWFLDEIKSRKAAPPSVNVRYTNAKVLLVGDSGVGKTGLTYRLAEGRFKDSVSSDAVWATQLKLPHASASDLIEREIWLWDFAGQADYRLIHQLYMDETALAVLVFNPQSENPFEGLIQWDGDIQRAARRTFRKLLVAGRCDRGGLMISRKSIELFQQEHGFSDYIETSALRGTGCETLREAIVRHVPWEDISWTTSPRIFRLLKNQIVKLKDENKVLLRNAELKQQLELRLPDENFTPEQLRAVVGLLAGPGVVWRLEFGDFILLQPERVNAYAAAVLRSVRAHAEEIGCISEEIVIAGKLDYQDMKRLPVEEEQIVLRAMHQTFVDHGLCLREHTDKGTLLIFPSYFKRERPELDGHPLVLVTYQFSGPLDEIYSTLVVRLHHTPAFERDRLWRFAADFKTPAGKRLGLKMTKKAEGKADMEIYFEQGISNDMQVTFIRYVHDHLKIKAQDVHRLRHYVCGKCGNPIENRRAIQIRLEKGCKDIICPVCEERVELWDLIEEKFDSERFRRRVRRLGAQATASIDNESRELILVGHTYAIAGEAGQIYRQYTNSDHGIDGEIEFKDNHGKASGKRLYLQLKSGDSYLHTRKEDGAEIFSIKNDRHSEYWQQHGYPVMLVVRTSKGVIRWMDVSEYLRRESRGGKKTVRQVVFKGEPFTALNLRLMRDLFVSAPKSE